MYKTKGHMEGVHMEEMEKLLAKYEAMEKELIVMDDYDGGKAQMLRTIIEDLRKMMWWAM
jgi:hypothetical protein